MSESSIEQHDGRVTFRYERRLQHSVNTVWRAITDPVQIEQWTGNQAEIDLRAGGQYVSYHGTGDRVVDRVTRVEPPRRFEHTFWAEINPTALVTWELSQTDDGCLLVLTHSLDVEDVQTAAQTFGGDITTILSRNGAGWHHLLDQIAACLDDRTTSWSEQDRNALQQRYVGMVEELV